MDRTRARRGGISGLLLGLLTLALPGCLGTTAPPKAAPAPLQGAAIRVAALGDAAILPTVQSQLGEWQASRKATCDLLPKAVEPADLGNAHVVLFRGDRLGDLVDAGYLAVLPESIVQPPAPTSGPDDPGETKPKPGEASESEADELQFSDVIPAFRDQVTRYGKDRMALPVGGSALVLAFRRGAFDRPENRDAAKAESLTLSPPATWTDLDALARFFEGRDWDGDGQPDHGIALALGPDPEGVGVSTYLARASALGQHPDHFALLFDSDTMEPRLGSPPFVEALERLVALKASGPKGMATFDADAARKAFRAGHTAFLIDRAERAGTWGEGDGPLNLIGVAPLPGSERVYDPANKVWEPSRTPNRPSYLPFGGGWLVGVAASAKGVEREAAIDFARYLVNPETSNRVRSDRDFPLLPVRSSQVGLGLLDPRSAPGVESRAWGEAVARTFLAPRVEPGLRIPQAPGYLADLDAARAEAASGKPAAEALAAVASTWSARTKSLGLPRQLWHYRRSLNSLVTAPKPPPR